MSRNNPISYSEMNWGRIFVTSCECYLWLGRLDKRGYGVVGGKNTVLGRQTGAHRLAWWITHGEEPPTDLMVCHTCDISSCVNPAHLFLGTAKDNMRDAVEKGRLDMTLKKLAAHSRSEAGKLRTLETRHKISISLKGRKVPQKHIEARRAGLRKAWENPEARERMTEAIRKHVAARTPEQKVKMLKNLYKGHIAAANKSRGAKK